VTGIRGYEPEEERLLDAGKLLLNRVALTLVAEARGHGFDDEKALLARAKELAKGARLTLNSKGVIDLSVPCGKGIRATASLRGDGVVLGGGTSGPTRTSTRKRSEFTPEELEEEHRLELAKAARRGKPSFKGIDYLRTVVAAPQPDADLVVVAVEIYEDGFYVDFTYDNEVDPEREAAEPWRDPKPPMTVEDDLGTDYYEGARATFSGSPVSNSTFNFAPTSPAAATVLRITTDSGTVELDLTS
jgi:hypothetical protein